MKSRLWLHIIVIVLLGLVAYSNTLSAPFVFDDEPVILGNPLINDVSNIPDMLAGVEGPWASRPLMNVTFALNYLASGYDTWSYHAANLALHVFNALLLFALIIMTGRRAGYGEDVLRLTAVFASALFVAHPALTEGVTYITSRSMLLAAFFCFSGLILFHEATASTKWRGVYMAGLFAASLMGMGSRENFMAFPALLVIYDLFFISRFRVREAAGKYKIYLPVFLSLLYLAFLSYVNTYDRAADFPGKGLDPLDYLLTEFRVHWSYLKLLAFPVGQSIDHDYPIVKGLADFPALIELTAGYAGLWTVAIVYARKRPATSFGAMWFLVALLPVSVGLSLGGWLMGMRLGDVMAEHRLYLPSAGVFLAIGAGAASIAVRGKKQLAITTAVFAVLCMLLAGAAYKRNEVWGSERALWEDAVAKSPGSYRAHYNLGNIYRLEGRLDEAELQYLESLRLEPGFHRTHHNLGVVYFGQGRLDVAVGQFQRALEIKSDLALAHFGLGMTYAVQGEYETALPYLQETVMLWPGYAEGRLQLGKALLELGRTEEARAELEAAARLDPARIEIRYLLESIR